jgi:glycosyltransferase involved in cell wall biosynthesis
MKEPYNSTRASHVRQARVGVPMADREWALDGRSNAIVKSMSRGLPVVCGEGGGNRKLVVNGKTGFVMAPPNKQALAQWVAGLCDHEAERQAMGAAGRRQIV